MGWALVGLSWQIWPDIRRTLAVGPPGALVSSGVHVHSKCDHDWLAILESGAAGCGTRSRPQERSLCYHPRMSALKTTVLATLVILLCAACFADQAFSQGQQKTALAVPCVWHFNVFQYDEYQHETIGLTAKQLDWYQKKLEKKGKYPYVCYDPTVTSKSTDVANAVIFVITVSRSQRSGT